jgi:hypothetical protein
MDGPAAAHDRISSAKCPPQVTADSVPPVLVEPNDAQPVRPLDPAGTGKSRPPD